MTLTIDRKRFESGEEAYNFIRPKLRTFLRLAGFKKAFGVMAFHPTAPEWPHWHLLVDVDDCGGWVDLQRLWHIWREKWGVGGLDLGLKDTRDKSATAGVRYIVSYCQHQAGVVGPWVLQRKRVPRCFEFYGELRTAIRAQTEPESEPGGAEPKKRRASSARSVGDRLQDCGQGATVLLCRRWKDGGTSYKFVGSLAARPGRIALADALGQLPSHLGIVRERVELPGDSGWHQRVSVPLGLNDDPKRVLERLSAAVSALPTLPVRLMQDKANESLIAGEECDVPF